MAGEKDVGIELAKGVAGEAVKEIQEERSFAMQLVEMQKTSSKRQFVSMIVAWIVTAVVVLTAMYERLQYDYTSSIDATGIFTAVDQSGVVIAQDITPEQWEMFMEWLNGQDKSEKVEDKEK